MTDYVFTCLTELCILMFITMMYLLDLYDILMSMCSKNVVCGYMVYNTFLF